MSVQVEQKELVTQAIKVLAVEQVELAEILALQDILLMVVVEQVDLVRQEKRMEMHLVLVDHLSQGRVVEQVELMERQVAQEFRQAKLAEAVASGASRILLRGSDSPTLETESIGEALAKDELQPRLL